jgi:hypothetical protein
MRNFLLGMLAIVGVAFTTPASAQVIVDTPVGGVQVGRDHDNDRWRDRRYREREYVERRECRTVTIERDDGSVKRIRRCD